MDYNRWSDMQHYSLQNPNPNPPPIEPYSNNLYTTHYPSHYSYYDPQHPNPNPYNHLSIDPLKPHEPHYSIGLDRGFRPPGFHPDASVSYGGGYEAYQPRMAYAHHQTVDAGAVAVPSGYYQDPIDFAAVQRAKDVIRHYESTKYAIEQLVPAHANSTLWTNAIDRPRGNNTWKRGPKKTKIIQAAWCDVCKVECSGKDILDQHKVGKKHKNNLEKLKQVTAPPPVASGVSDNPVHEHKLGKKHKKNPEKLKQVTAPPPVASRVSDNPVHEHKLGEKHKKNLEGLKQLTAPAPVASGVSDNPVHGHKLGKKRKKHKKNLEKLKQVTAPIPVASGVADNPVLGPQEVTAPPPVASGGSDNPVFGPQEKPDKGKAASVGKTRKKTAEHGEGLETKRRKILKSGAPTDTVRTCTICNVVCNSETVLKYHLAGQKHASMMKKHADGAGVTTT